MATGPGRGQALGAAGFGHLRASHADREQVIEALKAAFVQGRLTKDELEARAGRAFAARTYAELAALTTDLPAGLADAVLPRAQAGRPMSNVTRAGIWLTIAVAVPAVLSLLGGAQLFLLLTPFYFMGLSFLGAEIVASRLKTRSLRGQPPPGPGLGAQSSARLPSAGPAGQLPLSDPGHQNTAEAAPIVRPRPLPS